jgi:hypothetical protein
MLNLPELENIAFTGGMGYTERINFNLPFLKHLYLERNYPTLFVDPPSLSPTSITWVICGFGRKKWTSALKEEALKALFRFCGSVEILTITESTEDPLLSVISDLKHTGGLPPSLRIVRIASDPDVETILRTWTLAQLEVCSLY